MPRSRLQNNRQKIIAKVDSLIGFVDDARRPENILNLGLLIPEVDEEDAGIIQRSYVRALLEQARIAWGMLAEAILRERRERRLFDRMTTVRGAPIRVPMRIPVRG